jgi:hypothetical protein
MEYDLAKDIFSNGELQYILSFLYNLLINRQTEYGYVKLSIENVKKNAKTHEERVTCEQQLQEVESCLLKDKKVIANVVLDVYEHRSLYREQSSGYCGVITSTTIESMLKKLPQELLIQSLSILNYEGKLYCLHMLLSHETNMGNMDIVDAILKTLSMDEIKGLLTMATNNNQKSLMDLLSRVIEKH